MDTDKLIVGPLWKAYSSLAVALLSRGVRWLVATYSRSAASGLLRMAFPVLFAAAACIGWAVLGWPELPHVVALSTLVVLAFAVAELMAFWRCGIQGADATVRSGLNYEKALNLCQNEIWLLGIGAAKLTSLDSFASALRRCAQVHGGSLRFLLLQPGSNHLQAASKQAGGHDDDYQVRVAESLRKLARLCVKDGIRMEVRFYSEMPVLRLMFIDNRLCLASYNALGHGDGSELPQLRVSRKDDAPAHASFYYAFRRHFETLWDRSEPWRPEEIVKQ